MELQSKSIRINKHTLVPEIVIQLVIPMAALPNLQAINEKTTDEFYMQLGKQLYDILTSGTAYYDFDAG